MDERCKFCAGPDPVRTFPAPRIVATFKDRPPVDNGTEWTACAVCSQLIARRDLKSLVDACFAATGGRLDVEPHVFEMRCAQVLGMFLSYQDMLQAQKAKLN